jgi:hypothetical protein
MNCP